MKLRNILPKLMKLQTISPRQAKRNDIKRTSHRAVKVMSLGINGWLSAGLPVESKYKS